MKRFECLILVSICVLWVCQGFELVFADDLNLPEDFNISEHFSYYGMGSGPGIDWQALYDPANNPILKDCLTETTMKSLQALGIPDLHRRLERLERGNLIKKVDERYQLAFPSIVGKKRAELKKIVEDSAVRLLPTAEKMIQQIRPTLEDHEEMLYHVLWSVIMDGPVAWQVAGQTLKQHVKQGDTSFNHKGWLVYPRHPFKCGTNSYGIPSGQLRISHSPNVFRAIRSSISQRQLDMSQYRAEFFQLIKQAAQAAKQGHPIASKSTKQTLYKCGLVDRQGKPKIFIIQCDLNNLEVVRLYVEMGQRFGEEIILNSDIIKIADTLDVEPGIAFLVAYHEISYEVLERLAEKKILDIPNIVTKSNDISEISKLISLTIVAEGIDVEQLLNILKNRKKEDSERATKDSKEK